MGPGQHVAPLQPGDAHAVAASMMIHGGVQGLGRVRSDRLTDSLTDWPYDAAVLVQDQESPVWEGLRGQQGGQGRDRPARGGLPVRQPTPHQPTHPPTHAPTIHTPTTHTHPPINMHGQ